MLSTIPAIGTGGHRHRSGRFTGWSRARHAPDVGTIPEQVHLGWGEEPATSVAVSWVSHCLRLQGGHRGGPSAPTRT
ncbi:hypothetical protein FAGKG844_130073 [Frankia sp. AgKG'84/4]